MSGAPIDIYCERLSAAFWAEPVNALTNLAFIIAAFCAFRHVKRAGAMDWGAGLLVTLLFIIGIGSFLFHSFAVFWAMLADTLPILAFQLVFIGLYAARVMRLGLVQVGAVYAVFVGLIVSSGLLPQDWLNGSLSYLPAAILLSCFGAWHYASGQIKQERLILLLASGVFLLSLTFRSVDMLICTHFALGTHFIWHVLNAIVLYLCVRGYAKNALKSN